MGRWARSSPNFLKVSTALLMVPGPAEVGGEGAGGGPPVEVLHVPQLEDLLDDVFELVERW